MSWSVGEPCYRHAGGEIARELPFRIRLPSGETRTDPQQWWADESVASQSGWSKSVVTKQDIDTLYPDIIPASVTARQIRLWLVTHGVSLGAVAAAIQAIPDAATRATVAVEWEYAPYIERGHPMILPLAAALGMTSEQVDAAFREAAAL